MSDGTDDLVDNILGDRDFNDIFADQNNNNNNKGDAVSNSQSDPSSIANYQVFNDNNELVGFQCARVLENNPNLVDIPLLFYIDMKFRKGDNSNNNSTEVSAMRQVQTELLLAIARDFRITTGKACTDPPPNGVSWLVSIRSEVDQLKRETTTFKKCRELSFNATTEECLVYEFGLTGNVLTGRKMPDVEAVVETLFVNQVESAIDASIDVKFLGIPKYEDGGADDKTLINPPSSLNDAQTQSTPGNRQTITLVGGVLVAAFCLASLAILFILYDRRKKQRQLERSLNDSPKHFSHDTEDDDDYDHEVPPQHLYPLDLSNSFNQQVFGAHHQNAGARGAAKHPQNLPPPATGRSTKYLSNVNNQASYSHFHATTSPMDLMSESDADSWAQTDGTIGSLELQLEPITGEIWCQLRQQISVWGSTGVRKRRDVGGYLRRNANYKTVCSPYNCITSSETSLYTSSLVYKRPERLIHVN